MSYLSSFTGPQIDSGIGLANTALQSSAAFNLLTHYGVNEKGYATTGWYWVLLFGGGSSFSVGTAAPTNYPPVSLRIVSTGVSELFSCDTTSGSTVKSTAIRVSPGEVFAYSLYSSLASGSANNKAYLTFYDSTGAPISNSSLLYLSSSTTWVSGTNTATAPSLAAYMALVIYCEVSTVDVCNIKVYQI